MVLHSAWNLLVPHARSDAPPEPRSHIAIWSCEVPSTCLKLPMATSLVPSGVRSSLETPTAALAEPAGEVGVQLWFTVTALPMYGSSAPVVASRVAMPPCGTPPTLVKAPPTNSRLPSRFTDCTLARSRVGVVKDVTFEPSARLSSTRPLVVTPLTAVKIPPT